MKTKLLIGIICFVLGALAGHFGPGLIKAEIDAHKADAAQEVSVEETILELIPAEEVKPEEKKAE